MSLSKLYTRIDFENDTTPALNETNLNLISKAVDDIDDRVIDLSGEIMMADTYATNAATSATNAATSESNASGYADDASDSADEAEASALVSEGYSSGTQNGAAVSSGSPYYQNNSKYYMEQAAAMSSEVSWADIAQVGAVNLLPDEATTQVINDVTFTVNDDGSITANGQAEADIVLYILGTGSTDYRMLPDIVGKAVKLTGCPSGGGNGTYYLKFMERTPTYIGHEDHGNGTTFTVQNGLTGCNCYLYIASGQTVSNLTFKPMIALASYNGGYVPYAKTNAELTDIISCPADTNGTYTLQAVVSSGVVTYSWVTSS